MDESLVVVLVILIMSAVFLMSGLNLKNRVFLLGFDVE